MKFWTIGELFNYGWISTVIYYFAVLISRDQLSFYLCHKRTINSLSSIMAELLIFRLTFELWVNFELLVMVLMCVSVCVSVSLCVFLSPLTHDSKVKWDLVQCEMGFVLIWNCIFSDVKLDFFLNFIVWYWLGVMV